MTENSGAMEIETLNDNLSKPLINGSSKHDTEEDVKEKYKLTLSKINFKISQMENFLRDISEKQATSTITQTNTQTNSKYNTRKRKPTNAVADYDPLDDFEYPTSKRKSVTSSPILPTSGRRSRRSSGSNSSVSNIKSPKRTQRASSRRKSSQPLHPNVIEGLEYCRKIIQDLRKHKMAFPFLKPVDPIALKIPDYFDVIKEPMDLGTVKERLESNFYGNVYEFAEDTKLVWSNALTYNHPDSDVSKMAKSLSDLFEESIAKAIEISEKTTEETKQEYLDKIKTYQNEIQEYEQLMNEIKEQMPNDIVPMIEVKRIKSNSRTNRPMLYEEKLRLSKSINELDEKYYSGIVSIIEQELPDQLKTDSEEIELDIDEFESYVLWRLEDYIKTYTTPSSNQVEEVTTNVETSQSNDLANVQPKEDPNGDIESSSSDSDSESSDSDSDSDDESSIDPSRNVLVSKTKEASVSSGPIDSSTSIVQSEANVKNVEIQNADSWSKLNIAEESSDSKIGINDSISSDGKVENSDPLWQEFLNRGKQNLQREKTKAEQEEKIKKERELKEQQERERVQHEEEEKKAKEEEIKRKRDEEIKKRREEERRKRENEINNVSSSNGMMDSFMSPDQFKDAMRL